MYKIKVVMTFLQVFVSNILIFLVEAEHYNSTEPDIFSNITPLHYKLDLMMNIEESFFRGESHITIRLDENMQSIKFHSKVFIDEVTLTKINLNNTVPNNVTIKEPSVDYLSELDLVNLLFNEIIERGYYMLNIKFHNNIPNYITNTNGFIRSTCLDVIGNRRWIITTRVQRKGPQAIFPCWDNPRFKTIFQVSVYYSKNCIILSNSKVDYSVDSENGMRRTFFEPTSPISPHCINIVIMPHYQNYDFGYNITMWTASNYITFDFSKFSFAKKISVKVTKYLQKQNFIDHCNVAETNYIAVKSFPLKIIATPAFVLYREEDIAVSQELFSLEQKHNIVMLIAKQITYQWILRSTKSLYWFSSWLQDMYNFFTVYILQQLQEVEVKNLPILSTYEHTNFTSFFFNMTDIMKFILSSTTILASLCDSGNLH